MIGNDAGCHGEIYRYAMEVPGLIILHDWILHHLVAGTTLGKQKKETYFRQVEANHGFVAMEKARNALREDRAEEIFFTYPMNQTLLRKSLGVVVHNQWTANRIMSNISDLPVAVIPHLISLDEPEDLDTVSFKREKGIGTFPLLTCLGHMTRAKRIEQVVRACKVLHDCGIHYRLALIGDQKKDFNLSALINRYGLQEQVILTGYVDDQEFLSWIKATDVCINLRYPTAGETSGTLLKAMNFGKPVVVSHIAQYDEIPDGCCVKVDLGEYEEALLARYLQLLIEDSRLRRSIGSYAQSYIRWFADPGKVAVEYRDFIMHLLNIPQKEPIEVSLPKPSEWIAQEDTLSCMLIRQNEDNFDEIWGKKDGI